MIALSSPISVRTTRRVIARGMVLTTITLGVGGGVVGVGGMGGCSSDNTTVTASTSSTPRAATQVNATTATDPDAPLTLFEQRRLLNRIAADPRTQLQRLSPRERRGLAQMAEAAKKKDDNEN